MSVMGTDEGQPRAMTDPMSEFSNGPQSILLFGDDKGLSQVLRILSPELVVGLVGAEIRSHQHPVLEQLAEVHRLPFLVQPRSTSPAFQAFVDTIRNLAPDLILVNSYSMLIRPDVLTIPRFGAVNIHGGLLPEYRGCNPIQWALLNNEAETGVSMHYMSADFDGGDIIAQRRVPIAFEDTWRDVQERIVTAIDAMLSEELPKLLACTNDRQPQDETRAKYHRRRQPEDGLIDWHDSIVNIYNLVRALVKPHPGAFFHKGSEKIVLDDYLFIQEIMALKYGDAGGQRLTTEEIRLTPIAAADVHMIVKAMTHGIRCIGGALPRFVVADTGNQELLKVLRKRNDLIIFGICHTKTGRLIGSCAVSDIDYGHQEAHLNCAMDKCAGTHRDYSGHAVKLLVVFAFKELQLKRLHTHAPSNDVKTIHLLEEMGFVLERSQQTDSQIEIEHLDSVVMGMSRREWAPEK